MIDHGDEFSFPALVCLKCPIDNLIRSRKTEVVSSYFKKYLLSRAEQ